MKNKLFQAIALSATLMMTSALADGHSVPTSKWGPEDQAGASNYMTAEKALEAIGLMKSGTVVSIGRVYQSEMPLFGSRAFALRGTSGLAGGPLGANKVVWMDDFLATEIGQVGTQFDGLGHIGIGHDNGATFYNNNESKDVVGATGLKLLGMEHVKPFFTRGIVLDITAIRGAPMDAGDEVTVADIEAALDRQGIAGPGEGDVVLIHTGWGRHWITDNATFNSGAPGIGMEAARWLASKNIAIVGSDIWPVEVVPNPDSNNAFDAHQELITRNGIFIHENLATEVLVNAGVSEFAYIYSPLSVKGATGSPGAPLAAY
ncbi:MAG: cyclase family protein [Pseudomonadota bacterium]